MKLLIMSLICIAILGIVKCCIKYLINESIEIEKRYVFLILCLVVLVMSIPALESFVYKSHDIRFHLDRIAALGIEFENLQFPVRMQTVMAGGYSYATSLLYGDIFLYVPAALYMVGVPVDLCYNIYVILINVVTVYIAYKSFNGVFQNNKLALLGTILYGLAAYRMSCVFVRGSVGEYTAYAFLPMLIWGIYNVLESEGRVSMKKYFPIVVGATGILESHILTCELTIEFLAVFLVFNIRKVCKMEKLLAFLKSAMWVVAINLFFILPFVVSYGMDLRIKHMLAIGIDKEGLYFPQLVNVFYKYNSEFSKWGMQNEMTLCLGFVLFAAIVAMFICVMNKQKWKLEKTLEYKYGVQLTVLAGIALVLSTVYFPWRQVKRVGNIIGKIACMVQFPWRYLEIATALLVFVWLCVFKILLQKKEKRYVLCTAAVVIALSVISTGYFISTCSENGEEMDVSNIYDIGTIDLSGQEYLIEGTSMEGIGEYNEPVAGTGSSINLSNYRIEKGIKKVDCVNKSIQSSVMTMPVFNYDNYVAYDERTGETMEISDGANHAIEVTVPANYEGTIAVEYREPFLWRIAEIISLGTFIWFCVCMYKTKKEVDKDE